MKNRLKFIIGAFCIVCVVLLFGFFAKAEIASGTSGTCSWVIDDDGLLTIYPTDGVSGTLLSSPPNTYGLWRDYKDLIIRVFVAPGVKTGFSAHHLFYDFSKCVEMDVSNLDTSGTSDMSYMFDGLRSITHLDLSSFDTSSVTNMRWMIGSCSELVSVDIFSFDTSNCNDMCAFFGNNHKLKSVRVGPRLVPNGCGISGSPSDLSTLWFELPSPSYQLGLYTNKWIREDGMFGPFSRSDFSLNYSSDMAGTWIFEVAIVPYAVFDDVDDTLYFVREQVIHENGSFGTVHSISGNDYTGTIFFVNELQGGRNWSSISRRVLHVKFVDKIFPVSVVDWFDSFISCVDFDLLNLDVSNCNNMSGLFCDCASVLNLDLSHFDTSNVENMGYMFSGCSNLVSLDIRDFSTMNVTNFRSMFNGCRNIRSLDLYNFDTINGDDMRYMFGNCSGLISLDLSNFNTSSVKRIDSMFYNCSNLVSLDLYGFDTNAATRMNNMFYGCSNLHSIRLGTGFDFFGNNISNSSYQCVFPVPSDNRYTGKWELDGGVYGPYSPSELRDIYGPEMAGVWVCEIADNPYALFDDLSNTLYFIRVKDIFSNNSDVVAHSISGEDYSGLIFCVDEFSEFGDNRTWGSVAKFVEKVVFVDEISPKCVSSWFDGFSNCVDFDVDNLNVSNVVRMIDMFNGCFSVVNLDLHLFDTSSVTSMCRMFNNCKSLRSLNVDGFDTSSVVNMESMFVGCDSLLELDISSFDTSSVESMGYMFVAHTLSCGLRSVTLGENFSFKGSKSDSILSNVNMQAVLPSPLSSVSNGKWIRNDGEFGPYTPVELRNSYDGSTMAGTWVWDDGTYYIKINSPLFESDKYIVYNDMVSGKNNQTVSLSDNLIRRYGYKLIGWNEDSSSDSVLYATDSVGMATVPANTYDSHKTINLYAVFEKMDLSVSAVNGEFEFDLPGGSAVSFDDLPGNTRYQVYEETASGWQLVDSGNTSGQISTNGNVVSVFKNHYDPSVARFKLTGQKRVVSSVGTVMYPSMGEYTFKLIDVTNGTNNEIQSVTNSDGGLIAFDEIELDSVGTFTYQVVEVPGDDLKMSYDGHVETVSVSVSDLGDGNLETEVVYDSDGILFVNRLNDTGSLKISKQALNKDGDDCWQDGDKFLFDVVFTDKYGLVPSGGYQNCLLSLADSNGFTYDVSTGILHVELVSDNRSVVVSGIPYGLHYVVNEIVDNNSLYVLDSLSGESGVISDVVSEARFVNVFESVPVSVSFVAYKSADFDLNDGQFSFELLDSNMNVIQTVTNGIVLQDGAYDGLAPVMFDSIDFDGVGSYVYYIREVVGREDVIYDDSLIKVVVDVNDNNGRLYTDVDYFLVE